MKKGKSKIKKQLEILLTDSSVQPFDHCVGAKALNIFLFGL